MSKPSPEFYLASSEGYDMEVPRKCYCIRRFRGNYRDDFLLVKVDPPFIGQEYGLGDRDIDTVVIATRHEGASLFPIRKWPVFVHVGRLLVDDLEDRDVLHRTDFEEIGWGELYPTESAAWEKRM